MRKLACYWHPTRETRLCCAHCNTPICTECVHHHPVGIRCKECAQKMQLPIYRISTMYYAKGIGAAIGLGLTGFIALSVLFAILPFAGGLLLFISMGGVGYVIGEGVGKAVNQRRGRPYQYMALTGALIATVPFGLESLLSFSIGGFFNLGGVAIAGFVAWDRRAV